MKKRRTNSVLLLSTLTTMIFCTTAKAGEVEDRTTSFKQDTIVKNLDDFTTTRALKAFEDRSRPTTKPFEYCSTTKDFDPTKLSKPILFIKFNPISGHQDLIGQILKNNPPSAELQNAKKKIGNKLYLLKQQQNFDVQKVPTDSIEFLNKILNHLKSQDDFGRENFDETD